MGTVRTESKQGNATILLVSFPNEKSAAQVGFKPTTYALQMLYQLSYQAYRKGTA